MSLNNAKHLGIRVRASRDGAITITPELVENIRAHRCCLTCVDWRPGPLELSPVYKELLWGRCARGWAMGSNGLTQTYGCLQHDPLVSAHDKAQRETDILPAIGTVVKSET